MAEEEVAMIKGCGMDFDDEIVGVGFGGRYVDKIEAVMQLTSVSKQRSSS